MLEPQPGFWIRLVEADARSITRGELPATVRQDVATMVRDYDAHLAQCQAALDARVSPRRQRA